METKIETQQLTKEEKDARKKIAQARHQKTYYEKNKALMAERAAAYYAKNKDKIAVQKAGYYRRTYIVPEFDLIEL